MKKILLLWYMEGDNFGDTLISETVKEQLASDEIVFVDHEVGDDWRKIVQCANKCDFLIFAGGGIIERYIPAVIRNWDKVLESLQVPYGVVGLGVGEFNYSEYAISLMKWVDNSTFFYVRDQHSKVVLDKYALSQNVKYSADCVFANMKIKIWKKQPNGPSMNVRDLPYPDLSGELDWTVINEIIRDFNIKTTIMDSSNEYTKSINYNEFQEREYSSLAKIEKVNNIIDDICASEWILAMRFHVILVAARLEILTIPVKYCPKVKFLAEQLGLESISVNDKELHKISGKITEMLCNRQWYENELKRNVAALEGRALDMFSEVKIVLKEVLK